MGKNHAVLKELKREKAANDKLMQMAFDSKQKALAAPNDQQRFLEDIGLGHQIKKASEAQRAIVEMKELNEEWKTDLYTGEQIYNFAKRYMLTISSFNNYEGGISQDMADTMQTYFNAKGYDKHESGNMYILAKSADIKASDSEPELMIIHRVSNPRRAIDNYWAIIYTSPELFSFWRYVGGLAAKDKEHMGVAAGLGLMSIFWIIKMAVVTSAWHWGFFIGNILAGLTVWIFFTTKIYGASSDRPNWSWRAVYHKRVHEVLIENQYNRY